MFISTVAGSIGTATESRRASVIEVSAQKRANRRRVADKTVPWKTFKSIFFLICLIFLIIQSVDFLRIYYKYPTAIQQETIVPKNLKLPAITLCFRNTISYKIFCSYEPDWCEKPSNMEEFCTKHPIECIFGGSTLRIPKKGGYLEFALNRYLVNDSYNDASLFLIYNYRNKTRTFVGDIENPGRFLKCYSENLHTYQSRSRPETWEIDFDKNKDGLVSISMFLQTFIEPFYSKDETQVFLGIHSPYLPIDPMNLHAIRPGKIYAIDVQLEKEEHLLPPPYQTNCKDNGPSKDAKEFTNPNSHKMCLELCRSEFEKGLSLCDSGLTMVPSPSDLCMGDGPPIISSEQGDELKKKRLICIQNCQQECLKLHYKHTIREIDATKLVGDTISTIQFYVKNPEVTVLRHFPLYGSSEIFSNIGGLLGCWLGMSVFTFTDILEKFFWKVVRWKRRFRKRRFGKTIFRKKREHIAPQNSEVHQD